MSDWPQAPQRGEVWYAYTPGRPRDPHQPRPVLVVSEDVPNARRGDHIIIPIFSRGRAGPTRVPLLAGAGGVLRDSVLFCEEIAAIDHDFFEEGPLGERVPEDLLARVLRAVRRALGELVPEPADGLQG